MFRRYQILTHVTRQKCFQNEVSVLHTTIFKLTYRNILCQLQPSKKYAGFGLNKKYMLASVIETYHNYAPPYFVLHLY